MNEAQRKAVLTTEGPVMIVAGPGTGKTLTITRRIAYLIRQGVNPGKILAVTFTNRAAREMRERAESLLGKEAMGVFIGTFHLLGLRIIQDVLPGEFIILNRDDQAEILKPLLKGSGIKVHRAAEIISRMKNLLEEPDQKMKEIYTEYQSLLTAKSALDFDDLILRPIEILADQTYRSGFTHIMVDEYQDINAAQYRLLSLLTQTTCNLCVIGDSDQAIYAFRGADITNFLNFENDYRDAEKIILKDNYRATSTILRASDQLIKNNLKRIEKNLNPTREGGVPVTVVSVPDEKAEGSFIIREIEERIGGTSHYQLIHKTENSDGGSHCFADFAVIFRTNAQSKALEESFHASGIPCQIAGRLCRFPGNKLEKALIERKEILERGLPFDEFLNEVINESGLASEFGESDLTLLQAIASHYKDVAPSEALSGFINELILLTPSEIYDSGADMVTLMTLHMAKGLEFRVVFIAGVDEGLIPCSMKRDDVDIEEERRLFYVGMTRAKDELFLLHARSRFLYGQRLNPSPSPFLKDIPGELVKNLTIPDRPKEKKERQIRLF
ncbi:MAG: UvrD-helicase domain-containing protein [Nitrospirota bacterium]